MDRSRSSTSRACSARRSRSVTAWRAAGEHSAASRSSAPAVRLARRGRSSAPAPRKPVSQRAGRLVPQRQALASSLQPIERRHRRLAPARGIRELVLGSRPVRQESFEPRLGAAPRERGVVSSTLDLLRRRPASSRSSSATRAWSDAISIASLSARSAAVAWSARGRRRFRTSSSTSFARSTCTATRASLSSAR